MDPDESFSEPTKVLWEALRGNGGGPLGPLIDDVQARAADFNATNSWGVSIAIMGVQAPCGSPEASERLMRRLVEGGAARVEADGKGGALHMASKFLKNGRMGRFLQGLLGEQRARQEALDLVAAALPAERESSTPRMWSGKWMRFPS